MVLVYCAKDKAGRWAPRPCLHLHFAIWTIFFSSLITLRHLWKKSNSNYPVGHLYYIPRRHWELFSTKSSILLFKITVSKGKTRWSRKLSAHSYLENRTHAECSSLVNFTGVLTFDLPYISMLLSAPFHTPTALLLRNSFDVYPNYFIDSLDWTWFLILWAQNQGCDLSSPVAFHFTSIVCPAPYKQGKAIGDGGDRDGLSSLPIPQNPIEAQLVTFSTVVMAEGERRWTLAHEREWKPRVGLDMLALLSTIQTTASFHINPGSCVVSDWKTNGSPRVPVGTKLQHTNHPASPGFSKHSVGSPAISHCFPHRVKSEQLSTVGTPSCTCVGAYHPHGSILS